MENYNKYLNLKSELKKKKIKLSDLKKKSSTPKGEIEKLEGEIEEDISGLSIIFDYIVSQNPEK